MNLITTSTPGRKREMVLVPEINPHSFLFFFERGACGHSYSLRDYSVPNHVTQRYAKDFGWTADDIRRKAKHIYDAPFLDVARLSDWHSYTVALNELHGLQKPVAQPTVPKQLASTVGPSACFPLLDEDQFRAHPKAGKTNDVRRMLDSPNSEDWVTWNMLKLMQMSSPNIWWKTLSAEAEQVNPRLKVSGMDSPTLEFWNSVASPREYETVNRQRMRISADPVLSARSRDPQPVEGRSEIDITFSLQSHLIFAEAKLDSDISMRTTYDPGRNQIIRNIDCLLDSAHGRTPYFWMFVRDVSPSRAYTQIIRHYQEDPKTLARVLPHRDPGVLQQVAQGLTLLTWREIGKEVCAIQPNDDERVAYIKRELWRRIQ